MSAESKTARTGLLERLKAGPVICAEGYLFELERRGYLQAGAFVPEVVLEFPEAVAQLHREFVRAGSDVVQALTYYAHRDKLRMIGKEDVLERLNREALRIARAAAAGQELLVAGDICNTNVYAPGDPATHTAVRAMFDEQVGWAAEANVDFVVAETFSFLGEALIALEAIRKAGLTSVVTLAVHKEGTLLELRPRPGHHAAADGARAGRLQRPSGGAAGPVPHAAAGAHLPVALGPGLRLRPGRPALPHRARPLPVLALRDRGVRPQGLGDRGALPGGLLRGRTAPHPQHGRGARENPARQPLLAGHEQALRAGDRHPPQGAQQGLRRQPLTGSHLMGSNFDS
jgi:hypothetical protein